MKKTMITSLIAAMTFAIAATPVFAATPKTGTISESKAKQIAITDAGVAEGSFRSNRYINYTSNKKSFL